MSFQRGSAVTSSFSVTAGGKKKQNKGEQDENETSGDM